MEERASRAPHTLIASAVIALAGFALGAIAIAHFMPDLGRKVFAVGGCTALLSFFLAQLSLRAAKRAKMSILLCIGMGYVAGTLNTALSLFVVSIWADPSNAAESIGFSIIAGVFGFVTGGPLGVAISTVYAVLVGTVHRACQDDARESFDQVLWKSGLWLTVVGALALVGAAALDSGRGLRVYDIELLTHMSGVFAWAGAMMWSVGTLRLSLRRRWVRQVRQGKVEGWSLLPLNDHDSDLLQLRRLLCSKDEPGEILVKRSPGVAKGVYRTGVQLEPRALV